MLAVESLLRGRMGRLRSDMATHTVSHVFLSLPRNATSVEGPSCHDTLSTITTLFISSVSSAISAAKALPQESSLRQV